MLDIKTQVLKITWPKQEPPAHLPNFESLARRYRFRLLGKACSDLGINSLLLAHHEDDQAETIMMRLTYGHGLKGLLGIRNPAGMPECYGLHGVHESGGLDSTLGRDTDQRDRISTSTACRSSRSGHQLPIETGGIQVYRPFLSFSKPRLIVTCLTEKIEWFEDHTNKDPTITVRNAVRHIYNNHSMPAALTKPAILALSARVNDRAAHRSEVVKSWLAKCKITGFETRAGTVRVRFADLNQFRESEPVWSPTDAGQIAAELLRQIILLVTPQEHVDITSLHGAVQYIFPELCQHSNQPLDATAFTTSGVYFKAIQTSSFEIQPYPFDNQKCEWLISRQPYTSGTLPKLQLDVPTIEDSWSPWHLYDGRYWIRVKNLSTVPLLIQPLKREQLSEFRASLKKVDRAGLQQLLKEKAPGNVRWTLPAIVKREEDGKETVVALPSLDLSVNGSESLGRWEIRYKKIYTADLSLGEGWLESLGAESA